MAFVSNAALVLKVIGGVILAIAHRQLIRAARDESTGWWIATFVIPGAAIIFGLRYLRHFATTLIAIVVGSLILVSGFGLDIYSAVQKARETAASETNSSDHDEPEEDDDDEEDIPSISSNQVPRNQPAANLPADLRDRTSKLQQRYAEITSARQKLDVKNEDAVRTFNLRAAEYHEALKRLRDDIQSAQSRK